MPGFHEQAFSREVPGPHFFTIGFALTGGERALASRKVQLALLAQDDLEFKDFARSCN